MVNVAKLMDTSLSRGGIRLEEVVFEAEGPCCGHAIEGAALRAFVLSCPPAIQRQIASTLVSIDFANVPLRPFLQYLANGMAAAAEEQGLRL